MKLKIGRTEITIPAFISGRFPEHRAEFDNFMKQLLSAQADKIRRQCEEATEKERRAGEALDKMRGGNIKDLFERLNPFKNLFRG
jgi:hypothetical protein